MDNVHITALYGAISALGAGIAWLAKLFYVDVKKAQAECENRHNQTKIDYEQRLQEERQECKQDLAEHKQVINTLQGQVNTLTSNVFEIMKGNSSGIHH